MMREVKELTGNAVQMIDWRRIAPSPHNRKVRTDTESYRELVASVRAMGVLSPLMVRPAVDDNGDPYFRVEEGKRGKKAGFFILDERRIMGDGGYQGEAPEFYFTREQAEAALPEYEIVFGERRWRAAIEADEEGGATVPCQVRELSEREAMELTVTENAVREDLTPLEEGRAVEILLGLGYSVDEAAEKLGKSRRWVVRRERFSSLAECWREAIEAGRLPRWGVGHIEVMTRIPTTSQRDLYETLNENRWGWGQAEDWPEAELADELQKYMHRLSKAPWSLKKKNLGGFGACVDCPMRSSRQPDLFDEDEEAAKKDTCLDAECWAGKKAAWLEEERARLEKRHGEDLLLLSQEHDADKRPEGAVYQYGLGMHPVPKGTEGARPALVLDGFDAGETRWMKPDAGRSGPSGGAGEKTVEEKKEQFDLRRRRRLIERIVGEIETCRLERTGGLIGQWQEKMAAVLGGADRTAYNEASMTVLRLAAALGSHKDMKLASSWREDKSWRQVTARAGASEEDCLRELLAEVCEVMRERLEGGIGGTPDLFEAFGQAELMGVDLEAEYAGVCEAMPYPKTWRAKAEAMEPVPLRDLVREPERDDEDGDTAAESEDD